MIITPGANNFQYAAKKYVAEILQGRYMPNEAMINRLTHYLTSEKDVTDFAQILVDAFDSGYMKSVNDHRDKLKELGYKVNIVSEKKSLK